MQCIDFTFFFQLIEDLEEENQLLKEEVALLRESAVRRSFTATIFSEAQLVLRCFDTVFRRPYRYFSVALKGILSVSNRYKIFASD